MWRFGLVLVLVACGDSSSPPDPDRATVVELEAGASPRALDLLFVIDDRSYVALVVEVARQVERLFEQLEHLEGGLPDLHVGFVSTDMGTSGSASPDPAPAIEPVGAGGCEGTGKGGALLTSGAPVAGSFLVDSRQADGTRARNYTGELAAVVEQMFKVGLVGCSFEQPLAAMRAAAVNPANAGFLRPDARLAIVFFTEDDDCSVADPALFEASESRFGPLSPFRCTRLGVRCAIGGGTPAAMAMPGWKLGCAPAPAGVLDDVHRFREELLVHKPDPRDIVIAAIASNAAPFSVSEPPFGLAPNCTKQVEDTSLFWHGFPAVRLRAFLDLFGDRAIAASPCDDLSEAMARFGRLIARSLGTSCITEPLADVEPRTPGLQVDCIVEDLDGATTTPIPPCSGEAATCWRIVADASRCPVTPGSLVLEIERAAPPAAGTLTRARCVTAP
jgi:hypothetical protein